MLAHVRAVQKLLVFCHHILPLVLHCLVPPADQIHCQAQGSTSNVEYESNIPGNTIPRKLGKESHELQYASKVSSVDVVVGLVG